ELGSNCRNRKFETGSGRRCFQCMVAAEVRRRILARKALSLRYLSGYVSWVGTTAHAWRRRHVWRASGPCSGAATSADFLTYEFSGMSSLASMPATGSVARSKELLRQDMAWNAASRQSSHRVEGVSAALRTHWNHVVSQIRLDVLGVHGGAGALLVLQRPLVFGAFDGAQV